MKKLSENHKSKFSLKNLLKPGQSLKERTVKGGFWLFSFQIINRLFGFIRTIILARLLSPNDFGLFGIALVTLDLIEIFSRTGFKQALIQKKTDIKSYLDTAWTAGIIRGVLIATILFFVSPHVSTFFKEPAAEPIVKIIGFAFILQPLANIAVLYFEKELEFHKYFVYQFIGTIANVAVAITAALILRSIWALVFGLIAENFAKCITSYIIDPYRPKLRLDLQKVKELYLFGRWILGSGILFFLLTQGDDILVGKILGAVALGFYQMAYRISCLPATEYSRLITRVTFPAYSKLQDNLDKLNAAYSRVFLLTTIFSFPTSGFIFILSPEFTRLFLGDQWMPIVPVMQILALYGLIRAIGGTTQPVFAAIGRPDITTKLQSGQLILMAILIYPLTYYWGIVGSAVAVTISVLVFHSVSVYLVIKTIQSAYKKISISILLPLLSTLVMILSIYVVKTYVFKNIGFLAFFLLGGIGIVAYVFIAILFDKYSHSGCKQIVQDQLSVLFQKYNK